MKQHITILLILFIIISLYNQCNKKNLNKLQNKATNNIIEAFSNYQLADASDSSGEWGYKIIGITNGQYGGRSKQEVLSNINSHVKDDYITQSEKDTYSSNGYVNSIIEGQQIGLTDCSYSFGDCMWVDSNNDDIEPSLDGQYAKQITNFTAQNYSNNVCLYNSVGEIVRYNRLPANEKNDCVSDLPPVDCKYENRYYNLDNFLKMPYYEFTKTRDKQYTGSSCSEVYGPNIDTTRKYFTNNPDVANSKRLPDIFGLGDYNTRQDTKIEFNINNNNAEKKSGWKILTKNFEVKVRNHNSSYNHVISNINVICHVNYILNFIIESNLYITEEITAGNEDYKIFITFKVIDVTFNKGDINCPGVPGQTNIPWNDSINFSNRKLAYEIGMKVNMYNFFISLNDTINNKIIYSLESNGIGYDIDGLEEILDANLSSNNYILSEFIPLDNIGGYLKIRITPAGSQLLITIDDDTNMHDSDTYNEVINLLSTPIQLNIKEVLLKNLINTYKNNIESVSI